MFRSFEGGKQPISAHSSGGENCFYHRGAFQPNPPPPHPHNCWAQISMHWWDGKFILEVIPDDGQECLSGIFVYKHIVL